MLLATVAVAISSANSYIDGAGKAYAAMPTAKIGKDNVVKLEVASTEAEIERGLMWRTSLPEDHGMVFLFHPPKKEQFWMHNCFISLDMLFIKDGKIVHIFEDVPPCKEKDPRQCPTYPEGEGIEVSEVVEVKGGWAKRHDVKVGDPVSFNVP